MDESSGEQSMKIGIRAHDFGKLSPGELADKLAVEGIEAIQLAVPKAIEGVESYADISDALLEQMRTVFTERGITIAVLGCYIEPSLEDTKARLAQIDTFFYGIDCATALNAVCIGTETTAFSGDEMKRAEQFGRLCDSIERMLKKAQPLGVTVAIEPVAVHTINTPIMAAKLLKEFSGSGLSMIFDPVNLLTPEKVLDQNRLWNESIVAFGESVKAIHVKDMTVKKGKFSPCLLGEGLIDYESVIAPWFCFHNKNISILREGIQKENVRNELVWIRQNFGVKKRASQRIAL
jgi:sugar phosphate isomerase/epimerase